MTVLRITVLLFLSHALSVLTLQASPAPGAMPEAGADARPRERLPINDGWRFHRDDPPGITANLDYDVRPELTDTRDDRPADAAPTEAEAPVGHADTVLKPWILPSGNAFVGDPARRHARPPGNPGGDVACVRADYDDSGWSRVDLPHDWAIAGPFLATGDFGGMGRLPSWGIGWYRRKINIPAADAGRSIHLEVDGAMSYATVWLNGHLVGGWPYGYSSWRLDLTPYVKYGDDNQLAIRLDNPPASSRWYPGGGIYRNVWLTKTQPVRVSQWGTHVTTRDVSHTSATVDVRISLENAGGAGVTVQVATEIFALDADGRRRGDAVGRIRSTSTTIAPGADARVSGSVSIVNPRLWGPPPGQRPHRYAAITTVTEAGRVVDEYETRFGIRELRFDPDWGLYVNGERVPIRGVNQHHDLGALGAAFNASAARRQLEMLREMGCNAVRMSHNPPAPELLELTDAMGFLVMDEAFDVWERRKTPLGFHLIFPDWHEQDLRALVRRDRNHPSVIAWSIGNEVGEQYTDAAGAALARRLRAIVREEDATRPVTSAMNWAGPDMPFPAELDLISLNYQGEGIRDTPEFEGTDRIRKMPQYPAFRARVPDKVIVSSEAASAFSSRGVYLFPVAREISGPVRDGRGGDSVNHHVTAYELHAADFGSSADKVFHAINRHPFVAGQFVWTGWDHLGEPTPYYAARSSYSGIIDLAGFRKDRFYLYQAHWRPDFPMVHLLPHWTWPERVGQVTPVHVFTSGDAAELFLNGRSLGRKVKGEYDSRLRWDDVVYEPGRLEVVAFRDGKHWATEAVVTAGAPARLEAEADRAEIGADGLDLAFVTVRVVDAHGVTAPRADNRIAFSIEGPGEIVATDNGDPTNFEPFPSASRRAFGGMCLAIMRARRGEAGRITVTASAEGLEVGRVFVTSTASTR